MELHVNLAELVGFLFKTHGEAFFPAFQELLLPSVLEMARPDSLAEDRKVICNWRRNCTAEGCI